MTLVRRHGFAIGLAGLLASSGAIANEPGTENVFSFSGFGTAGVVHNSTDKADFIRDILQPRGAAKGWSSDVDSRLGIQVNARPNAELEGVVQATSSYSAAGSYSPELTWAFLSYAPNPDLAVRVGRLGWAVYMLSDSRNVGYSYLWVRPPVDYFGQLLISHIDGADVVVKHPLAGGLASMKLYAGRVDQKVPARPGDDYDLAGTRVLGVNLDYQNGDWWLRAAYTAARIKNEQLNLIPLQDALRGTGIPAAASLADEIGFAGKQIRIASLGATYEHGPWRSIFMVNRLDSESLAYPQRDSAFLLLGYHSGQWTPFVSLSGTRSRASDRATGLPTPNPLDDGVSLAIAAAQGRQRTLSLGVRYDFMHNADLKIQFDQVRVFDHAGFLWRNVQPDWNGRANVLSIALDFVF